MKKRILMTLAAIAVTLSCIGCGKAAESADKTVAKTEGSEVKEYHIGTDGSTPGYSQLNAKNELEGFEIDFWNEVAKRYNVNIKFEQMAFASLFGLLDDGRLDTIANTIGPTDERRKKYDFSDSYIYEENVFMSAPDIEASTLKDLDGKSVGLVANSMDMEIMDEIEKTAGITVEKVMFEDTARNDVIAKKVDMCIQPKGLAAELENSLGKDKIKLLIGTGVFSESAYPCAKTKSGNEIREIANKAIKEMREDGTLKELSMKWFNVDLTVLPEN